MPSFETPADIFTRPFVFDSPKGSSDTLKTHLRVTFVTLTHLRYMTPSISLIFGTCVIMTTNAFSQNFSFLAYFLSKLQHLTRSASSFGQIAVFTISVFKVTQ